MVVQAAQHIQAMQFEAEAEASGPDTDLLLQPELRPAAAVASLEAAEAAEHELLQPELPMAAPPATLPAHACDSKRDGSIAHPTLSLLLAGVVGNTNAIFLKSSNLVPESNTSWLSRPHRESRDMGKSQRGIPTKSIVWAA